MKTKFYSEPSAVKCWINRNVVSHVEFMDNEFTMLRIRWWPAVVWLGHNLFLLMWYMLSAIAGRSVTFDNSGFWYWPLRTALKLLH